MKTKTTQALKKYGFLIAAGAVVVLEMGIQLWASWAIPSATVSQILHYGFPKAEAPGFALLDLKETSAPETLSYDRGALGRFRGAGSLSMDVFYLEHDAGNKRYLDDTYGHQPETCMTNAGAAFVKNYGIRTFECGDQPLRIRCLAFSEPPRNTNIFVYKLIWVPPGYDADGESTWDVRKKIWIRRALTRMSWPPSRLILAGVKGSGSEEDAWTFFKETVLEKVELVDAGRAKR